MSDILTLECSIPYKFMKNNGKTTEIASPCIRNCCLDARDICVGCFRCIDEILAWSDSTNQQRSEILKQAASRRAVQQKTYRQIYKQAND